MRITPFPKLLRSTKTWLAVVAAAGIMAAVLLAHFKRGEFTDGTIHHELFRFSLTVVVGGVIAFVFRMAEARRQVKDARQRDLRDFYRRMLAAYNEAKKIRRLLRARSHASDSGIQIRREDLDELMDSLQSAQLDFEALRREAEASRKLVSDNKLLEKPMARAQHYLREVLKVHEAMGPGDPVALRFDDGAVRRLLCFFHSADELKTKGVRAADCDSFEVEFSDQAHAVRRVIVKSSEDAAAED